jgi:uncharacterized protein YgbK (DUF1537 family)
LSVRVIANSGETVDFENYPEDVIAVDMDSRHLPSCEAKTITGNHVRDGQKSGIAWFYKKTDSALRGNVGAELEGFLDAVGRGTNGIIFVPAFPENGRTVIGGVLYVRGKPVAESVFGSDLFTPVKHSRVEDILHEQTDIPTKWISRKDYRDLGQPFLGIRIVDAETQDDIGSIASCLKGTTNSYFLAGCAGFADALGELIPSGSDNRRSLVSASSLLVVVGSLNPITAEQIEWSIQAGVPAITLTPEQKLSVDYLRSPACASFAERIAAELRKSRRLILRAAQDVGDADAVQRYAAANSIPEDELRGRIVSNISNITSQVLGKNRACALAVFGGDTLHGIIREMAPANVFPVSQIAPGVVAATLQTQHTERLLITKSGGLGGVDVMNTIETFLREHHGAECV